MLLITTERPLQFVFLGPHLPPLCPRPKASTLISAARHDRGRDDCASSALCSARLSNFARSQLRNKFPIRRKKIHGGQFPRLDPFHALENAIDNHAGCNPSGKEYQFNRTRHLRVLVARAVKFHADRRAEAQLLTQLTLERRLGRFSIPHFAAGKFPLQRKFSRATPLTRQHAPLARNHGG